MLLDVMAQNVNVYEIFECIVVWYVYVIARQGFITGCKGHT